MCRTPTAAAAASRRVRQPSKALVRPAATAGEGATAPDVTAGTLSDHKQLCCQLFVAQSLCVTSHQARSSCYSTTWTIHPPRQQQNKPGPPTPVDTPHLSHHTVNDLHTKPCACDPVLCACSGGCLLQGPGSHLVRPLSIPQCEPRRHSLCRLLPSTLPAAAAAAAARRPWHASAASPHASAQQCMHVLYA